jgi:hypothetical protein
MRVLYAVAHLLIIERFGHERWRQLCCLIISVASASVLCLHYDAYIADVRTFVPSSMQVNLFTQSYFSIDMLHMAYTILAGRGCRLDLLLHHTIGMCFCYRSYHWIGMTFVTIAEVLSIFPLFTKSRLMIAWLRTGTILLIRFMLWMHLAYHHGYVKYHQYDAVALVAIASAVSVFSCFDLFFLGRSLRVIVDS